MQNVPGWCLLEKKLPLKNENNTQMKNIGDNVEDNTETPVDENTTPDNNEDSNAGGNTY